MIFNYRLGTPVAGRTIMIMVPACQWLFLMMLVGQ
jgi:hypothetical protein